MTRDKPLVQILLATYNGEKYLEDLINSLLNQTYKNISILAHDDGSEDGTLDILRRYRDMYPDKIVILEDGIRTGGAVWNFEHLLSNSTSDYIMFADQDDVWLPEKVEITLNEMLSLEEKFGFSTPILVYTDVIVVDENLNKLSDSLWKYIKVDGSIISLGRALETSLGLGLTMMINKSLKEISLPFPSNTLIHDMWLSMVAVCFGRVKYIDRPTALYRQHSSNVAGAEKITLPMLVKKIFDTGQIDKFREDYMVRRNQAIDFFNKYKDFLCDKDLNLIQTYISLPTYNPLKRLYKVISNGIFRTGNFRDFGRLLLRWFFL